MCSQSTPYSNDFPFNLHIKLPIGYREILFLKYYNDFFKAIGGVPSGRVGLVGGGVGYL